MVEYIKCMGIILLMVIVYSTGDIEQLTNLLKISQCHSTGAMIDQVAHREQCQGVKELEDGIAWLVD